MENSSTKYKRYDEEFKRNAVELAGTSGRPVSAPPLYKKRILRQPATSTSA